jgi:hypothetical protein
MTVIPFPWRRELSSAAPPTIATDDLADWIFSWTARPSLWHKLRLPPMPGFLGKKKRSSTLFAHCSG